MWVRVVKGGNLINALAVLMLIRDWVIFNAMVFKRVKNEAYTLWEMVLKGPKNLGLYVVGKGLESNGNYLKEHI